MPRPTPTRQRPTEAERETRRRSHAVALVLGRDVRDERRHRGLTQARLADRVGVHQTRISQIERGEGTRVPLELWVALGVALGRPLAVSLSKPLGAQPEPIDAGHLAMQERLLQAARAVGRTATFEVPTRPSNPRHSIDVCVRDLRHRVLLIEEAWNTFGDLGAAVRSTNRKMAEASDLARTTNHAMSYRVAAVWIVRPTASNRRLVGRYPEIFRSAFPGSSRAWVLALTTDSPAPTRPGLVWLDPGTGRFTAWRRPSPKGFDGQ